MYVTLCIAARGSALNISLDHSDFPTATSRRIETLRFFFSWIGRV